MALKSSILAIALLAITCGQDGEQQNPPPEPKAPSIDGKPIQRPLTVSFTDHKKHEDFIKNCQYPMPFPSLKSQTGIKVDGRFQDWDLFGVSQKDPEGDHRRSADLTSYGAALGERDLFVAIATKERLKPEESLFLEFFTGHFSEESFHFSESLLVSIQNSTIKHTFGGPWQSPPTEAIKLAHGEDGIEIALSRDYLLAGILHAPIFGFRVSLGDKESWLDYSSILLSLGVKAKGYGFFREAGCFKDDDAATPLAYKEMIANNIPHETALKAKRLVRYAAHQLGAALGENSFPVDTIQVLMTDKPLSFHPMQPPPEFYLSGTAKNSLFGLEVKNAVAGLSQNTPFWLEENPQKAAFEDLLAHMVHQSLSTREKASFAPLKALLAAGITAGIIKEHLGIYAWSSYIQKKEHAPQQKLGFMLEHYLGYQNLASALAESENPAAFWQKTISLKPDSGDILNNISLQYSHPEKAFLAKHFTDTDHDGLLNFFETTGGEEPDSDKDGWSDLGELFLGTDPENIHSRPAMLFADGLFSDFVNLMPDRIESQTKKPAQGCPAISDLLSYTALQKEGALMIGASIGTSNKASKKEEPITWQIEIEGDSMDQKRVIKIPRGENTYHILDQNLSTIKIAHGPRPHAIYAIEIYLNTQSLNLPSLPERLKIKISSSLADGTMTQCDESKKFAPYKQN